MGRNYELRRLRSCALRLLSLCCCFHSAAIHLSSFDCSPVVSALTRLRHSAGVEAFSCGNSAAATTNFLILGMTANSNAAFGFAACSMVARRASRQPLGGVTPADK